MTQKNEIEIKSPDGQTTVLLRSNAEAIEVTHAAEKTGVNLRAEVNLNIDGAAPAKAALNKILDGTETPSPDPLTGLRLSHMAKRANDPMKTLTRVLRNAVEWLVLSAENTNYTYALTPRSIAYLAHTVAVATGTPIAAVRAYITEAEQDESLHRHIRTIAQQQPAEIRAVSDEVIHFGRRLGWYAVVRATKPALVIETGVDKGLGAVLLCAALQRNAKDGAPGRYMGTDINPKAGYLLAPPYSEMGEIVYGDSLATLRTVADPIGVFINDSDHSADYEADEYACVAPRLADNAIVLGDNSHATTKLSAFAEDTGRKFLFWREQPSNHWYPGAGIGFAFR